jgi:hypothetical protein
VGCSQVQLRAGTCRLGSTLANRGSVPGAFRRCSCTPRAWVTRNQFISFQALVLSSAVHTSTHDSWNTAANKQTATPFSLYHSLLQCNQVHQVSINTKVYQCHWQQCRGFFRVVSPSQQPAAADCMHLCSSCCRWLPSREANRGNSTCWL